MAYGKAAHHRGPHQVTARRVVARANADPSYVCPRCGLTRAQGIAVWGVNGEWDAGHIVAGDSSRGYRAEHAHCNRSDNKRKRNPQTRPW